MPKNDYVMLVNDARYFNSVTDLTNYSWPLEPAQMIMTQLNGKIFSVSAAIYCKRKKDLKNLKSPESKRDVLKVLGCIGFYICHIKNLLVDSQPFYNLIKDSTPFHWTHEHEKLVQSTKGRISENTILAVPSTDYPFHIHVDSSNI